MLSAKSLDNYLRLGIIFIIQALFLITPLIWTAETSELFEFPKMLWVYALAVMAGGLFIWRMALNRRWLIRRTLLDWVLLFFLGSQVLSTMFSIDTHTSIFGYYSRFHGGLLSTLAYLTLYYTAVSTFSKREVWLTVRSILGGAVIGALYAFPEHFGYSPSCLMITGNFDVACWVQDVQTRVFGTFGQPNWLAAYLIAVGFLPLSLGFDWFTRQETVAAKFRGVVKKVKGDVKQIDERQFKLIGYGLVFLLFASVLMFTKSRSGLLGFSLGFGILGAGLIYLYRQAWKQPLGLIAGAGVTITLLFFIFGGPVTTQLTNLLDGGGEPVAEQTEAVGGTQLEVGGTESGTIRRIVWQGAVDLFKKYPLFGSGVETFAYGYYNVRPVEHNLVSEWDFLYNKAHNEFLNILSTTGLVGLISYLSIMGAFTYLVVRGFLNNRLGTRERLLGLALLSGFWALAVSNFFGFSTVPVALVFFLFPALAGVALAESEAEEAMVKPRPVDGGEWIIGGIILVVVMVLLGQVYRLYAADKAYAKGKKFADADRLAQAIPFLQEASVKLKNEPVYTEQLSLVAAKAAAVLQQSEQATEAAQMARQAAALSDKTMSLNKVHLNYYKTRARVFVYLSQVNPQYIETARDALVEALRLAPTDAKILYNLALLYDQTGDDETALQLYEETIKLKPNYEGARMSLAQFYQKIEEPELAAEEYRYVLENLNPQNPAAIEGLEKVK
jgi:putative inorganic carbon (hco3(-)) transporter